MRTRSDLSTRDGYRTVVRGIPLFLEVGLLYEDRPAADVWFLLLGELHKDPVRFLSEEEIWQSLGAFCGCGFRCR